MLRAVFKFLKWLYLELVIIIIGIIMGYLFEANPLIFVIITISIIVGGGFILFGIYYLFQRTGIKFASRGEGVSIPDKTFVVMIIILTLITLFADFIHYIKFRFLTLTIIIAVLIIVSSVIIIIFITKEHPQIS